MKARIACPVCGMAIDLLLTNEDTAYGFGALDDAGSVEVTVVGREYYDHMLTHDKDPKYARALRAKADRLLQHASRIDLKDPGWN